MTWNDNGEVETRPFDNGVWIEIDHHDPQDGNLSWAHLTPDKARQLAVELVRIADQIEAKHPVPMPEYGAQPKGSGYMRMERVK